MSLGVEVAKLKANLWKLSVLRGLEYAWFPIPTIMIFYSYHGLSIEDGLLLKTILSFSIFLFEVPSGSFADVFGKRTSLISAGLVWIVATSCYIIGDSFLVFAIAEILCGLAASLISGADTAIAYDSLAALEAEGEYVKVEGRFGSVSSFSEALCGIIGAYVASFHVSYPFALMLGANIAFVLIALSLKEPPLQRSGQQRSILRQMMHVTAEVFARRPLVRLLCLYSAISSSGTFLIVWLSQSYMKEIDLPVQWFGIAWALFHIWMGLLSLSASRFEEKLGTTATFISMTVALGGAYLILALFTSFWGLLAVFLLYGLRGIRTPIIRGHLNRRLPSDIRATAMSLQSFLFRLLFVGLGPLIGRVVGLYSLPTGFVVAGVLLFSSSSVVLIYLFLTGMFSEGDRRATLYCSSNP